MGTYLIVHAEHDLTACLNENEYSKGIELTFESKKANQVLSLYLNNIEQAKTLINSLTEQLKNLTGK